MIVGCAILEEIEIGWGQRSDGCFLFTKKDELDSFKAKLDKSRKDFPEEFTVVDSVKTAEVSEKVFGLINKEENGLWLLRKEFFDFRKSGDIKIIS